MEAADGVLSKGVLGPIPADEDDKDAFKGDVLRPAVPEGILEPVGVLGGRAEVGLD